MLEKRSLFYAFVEAPFFVAKEQPLCVPVEVLPAPLSDLRRTQVEGRLRRQARGSPVLAPILREQMSHCLTFGALASWYAAKVSWLSSFGDARAEGERVEKTLRP